MNFTLNIWRQSNSEEPGRIVQYPVNNISADMSFLEMLDVVNEELVTKGKEPIAFDHDCREGICGACSMMINGIPHGPERGTTACQLHMRSFKDGDNIWIEPWLATAFPILKDLIVDRSAFDRVIQAGGYISVATGGAPDGNAVPITKTESDLSMDAAACIGCGACVAACPNASAMLFVSAKAAQFAHLPQGQPERYRRAKQMVDRMDLENFGNCTNHYECEAACPKEISVENITLLNRDYIRASLFGE